MVFYTLFMTPFFIITIITAHVIFLKSTYQIPLICKVRIGWVLAGFGCLFGGFRGDRGGFVAAFESAESELLHCTVNLSRGKKENVMSIIPFLLFALEKREKEKLE